MTDTSKNPKFWQEQPCAICNAVFWSLKKRNQKTCSAKCSGIYVARNPQRVSKIKKTKLLKYGNEAYVNPEKAKKTCLEKYGVDNVSKSHDVIEKIKAANQEKYGVDWTFQSEEVKSNIRESNLVNFGVEHVSQRKDVAEKKKKTFTKTLGVDNPFKSEKIRKKILQTNLAKYGTEYPTQSDPVKQKVHDYWKESSYDSFIQNHKLNSSYIPLFTKDEYVNTDRTNLYKFQCKSCMSIFEDHIDGGHLPRCIKCNPFDSTGTSSSENEVFDFVKSIFTGGEILQNSRNILPSGSELDIYIPSKKLAIEFNGLYWHSALAGKDHSYHLKKTEECESLGIHLIHIFEDEWKNKQELIKDKIRSKLITSKRIGARLLEVRKISAAEKNTFLEKYHIQGKDKSSIFYGGFYKNSLVSVITFGKQRIALGSRKADADVYELIRYATSTPVVGAMQKMIKVFRLEYSPKKLISYADRRFTNKNSNIYDSIGMKLVSVSPPNYWYFKNGYYTRYHRFGFRKQVLASRLSNFDSNLTEWGNMQRDGYNKIWDCGNLKYELNFI